MRKTFALLLCVAFLSNIASPAMAFEREALPELPVIPTVTVNPSAVLPAAMPALTAAQAISVPATPALQPVAAQSLLSLGAQVSARPARGQSPETVLSRRFDGSQAPARDSVSVDVPEGSGPSGLSAPLARSAQARRVPAPRASARWSTGLLDKILALPREVFIGAGVVVLIAALIVGIHHHAVQKNKHWQASKSAVNSQLIDQAKKTQDADTAEKIKQEAQARRDRMKKRIAEAQAKRTKIVEDATHDKLAQAKAYAAYDELVADRAELALNEISKNPAKRVGEKLPKTWQDELKGDEDTAVATRFDGFEALRLDKLDAELGREKGADQRLGQGLESFHQEVPGLFGGQMKQEYETALGELKNFEQGEISPEDALLQSKTAAMRGRVSDRLYGQDAQFHSRRDRRDRLSALYDRKVGPAVSTARQVDSDLDGMISERHTEAAMETLASLHTNDTEEYEDCHDEGEGQDEHEVCTTETRTADNSGPYRAAAAVAASAAQSDAESAQRGIESLRPMIAALHNDDAIRAENLLSSLPEGANASVDSGSGPLSDWFLPPLFGVFGSLSSADDGQQARSAFAPVLSSLENVSQQVTSRRDGEAQWVESQISSELQSEEAKAQSQAW